MTSGVKSEVDDRLSVSAGNLFWFRGNWAFKRLRTVIRFGMGSEWCNSGERMTLNSFEVALGLDFDLSVELTLD